MTVPSTGGRWAVAAAGRNAAPARAPAAVTKSRRVSSCDTSILRGRGRANKLPRVAARLKRKPMPQSASGRSAEQGSELQDRVPVATRAPCSERALDERVRQPRAADAVRVDDVGVHPRGPDDLGARGRAPLRRDVLRLGWLLQKHDDEMRGIALGFRGEGIARHDRLPLCGGADEAVGFQAQALRRLGLERALQAPARPGVTAQYEVAAL